MDNHNKLPCEDCITLAICKGRVSKMKSLQTASFTIIILALANHCSIVSEYMKIPIDRQSMGVNGPEARYLGIYDRRNVANLVRFYGAIRGV